MHEQRYSRVSYAYSGIAASYVNSLLDIGCGKATYFEDLNCELKVGLDIDNNFIKAANQIRGKDDFVVGKATRLPFRDNAFDVVLSLELIEHLNKDVHPILLSEVRRVLRPRGFLILTTPNAQNPLTQLKTRFPFLAALETKLMNKTQFKKKQMLWSKTVTGYMGMDLSEHKFRYSPWELERQLRISGFTLLKKEFCTFTWQVLIPIMEKFSSLSLGSLTRMIMAFIPLLDSLLAAMPFSYLISYQMLFVGRVLDE